MFVIRKDDNKSTRIKELLVSHQEIMEGKRREKLAKKQHISLARDKEILDQMLDDEIIDYDKDNED
jgi:hypothetical protein